MKRLIPILFVLVLGGCEKQPQLESVANLVPRVFECGIHSDEKIAALLKEFYEAPEVVTASVVEDMKTNALDTTCLLIDGKSYLERTGERLTERGRKVYQLVKDSLADLGL